MKASRLLKIKGLVACGTVSCVTALAIAGFTACGTKPRVVEATKTTTSTVTVTQTGTPTTTTPTITTPTPTLATQPESKLITGLLLPAGSVLNPPVSDELPQGMPPLPTPDGVESEYESWTVPLGKSATAAALKDQLPIRKPLDGIPWCGEFDTGTLHQVDWASSTYTIVVSVSNWDEVTNVRISRGLDDTGRGGCD